MTQSSTKSSRYTVSLTKSIIIPFHLSTHSPSNVYVTSKPIESSLNNVANIRYIVIIGNLQPVK